MNQNQKQNTLTSGSDIDPIEEMLQKFPAEAQVDISIRNLAAQTLALLLINTKMLRNDRYPHLYLGENYMSAKENVKRWEKLAGLSPLFLLVYSNTAEKVV